MKSLWRIIVILGLIPALFAQQDAKTSADQPAKKDIVERGAKPSDSYYKLSFVIFELEDGKRVNQREYTMISRVGGSPPSSVRSSTRVPIFVEEKKLQYVDAGLDLRCNVDDVVAGKVPVQCDVNISNFVLQEPAAEPHSAVGPVLRTMNVRTSTVLVPGKPTVISTIDDVNSKKRVQIEVTATKIE